MNDKKLEFIKWYCKHNPEAYKELQGFDFFFSTHFDEFQEWYVPEPELKKLLQIFYDKGIKLSDPKYILNIFNKFNDTKYIKDILKNNGLISFNDIPLNTPSNLCNLTSLHNETVKTLVMNYGSKSNGVGKGEEFLSLIIQEATRNKNQVGDGGDIRVVLNNEIKNIEVKGSHSNILTLDGLDINLVSKYFDDNLFKEPDEVIKNYFGYGYTCKRLLEKINERNIDIKDVLINLIKATAIQYKYELSDNELNTILNNVCKNKLLNGDVGNYSANTNYPIMDYLGRIELYFYVNRLNINYLLLFSPKTLNFILYSKESINNFNNLEWTTFTGTGGTKVTGEAHLSQEFSAGMNFNDKFYKKLYND